VSHALNEMPGLHFHQVSELHLPRAGSLESHRRRQSPSAALREGNLAIIECILSKVSDPNFVGRYDWQIIDLYLPPTGAYPCCVSLILTGSPLLFSSIFLTAAQHNSPSVTAMKVKTTIWSFLLSLWKHVVKTSFSSASLQMGRRRERQNALLHVAHVAPAVRGESPDGEEFEERGMMVLLVKQVHLQNEGGEAAKAEIMSAQRTRRI